MTDNISYDIIDILAKTFEENKKLRHDLEYANSLLEDLSEQICESENNKCCDIGFGRRFICSKCFCSFDLCDLYEEPVMWSNFTADVPKYCPNCGRKVEEASNE